MENQIKDVLSTLEQKKNIKISYACESGSRAWGFPSPDSDYDVRFLYVQPFDNYLSLQSPKDTIDMGVNELLDVSGWDIKKALILLKKSNAALIEWVHSPIVYQKDDSFLTEFKSIATECFSPIAVMHHYLSMAKRYFQICNEAENAKLKQYFYALRTSLNCMWVAENQTNPPVAFEGLLEFVKPTDLRNRIEALIKLKTEADESFVLTKEEKLLQFVKQNIEYCNDIASSLSSSKFDSKRIDSFFKKTIQK